MLPGKTYTPEDYLKAAWKRKWLIVIPTLLIAVGTFVWTYMLPNRYRASSTMIIVAQRVPESYVRPTVTAQIGERLQVISQQILSRTQLERIIEEFNLYETERETLIMEDVIERMRTQDVGINLGTTRESDTSTFTVSYEAPNARTAMLVTERLASLFIQENIQDREMLADSTNQFLEAQLEEARRRLVEHEKKLEAFRLQNGGRLPGQVNSNLQMMQTAQMQLQAFDEASNRDRDMLTVLERSLAEAISAAEVAPVTADVAAGGGTAAQQLEMARAALRTLELRLKPGHPDIGRANRAIAELEQKAEAEALQQPLTAGGTLQISAAIRARVLEIRAEMENIRLRLESRKREDATLRARIAGYQARVEAAPGLESALSELMRDYSTLETGYTSLLVKSEESKMSVNLERRQIGEQFRILDGARLPERPVSPDRPRLNIMGLLAGLGVGLALAGLIEYRDTTLKTDDDVTTSLALPVLAVIPLMLTAVERQRSKRLKLVVAVSASAVVVVMAVAVIAVVRFGVLDAWVR